MAFARQRGRCAASVCGRFVENGMEGVGLEEYHMNVGSLGLGDTVMSEQK